MLNQIKITLKDQTLFLAGELNFHNVMSAYQDSLKYLDKLPHYQFDFSQVKKSNSAGLALIFEWIKCAKIHQKTIRFSGISAHLLSIAKVADCDGLIRIA